MGSNMRFPWQGWITLIRLKDYHVNVLYENYDLSKYGQKTCPKLIRHLRVFFCIVETCTLHKKLFEGRKLKRHYENPNHMYFEKQYDQMF